MNSRGQSLVEFVMIITVLTGTAVGILSLSKGAWDRARCARLAFEAAHLARLGSLSNLSSNQVQIAQIPGGFQASALCGDIRETVKLPTLEQGQW